MALWCRHVASFAPRGGRRFPGPYAAGRGGPGRALTRQLTGATGVLSSVVAQPGAARPWEGPAAAAAAGLAVPGRQSGRPLSRSPVAHSTRLQDDRRPGAPVAHSTPRTLWGYRTTRAMPARCAACTRSVRDDPARCAACRRVAVLPLPAAPLIIRTSGVGSEQGAVAPITPDWAGIRQAWTSWAPLPTAVSASTLSRGKPLAGRAATAPGGLSPTGTLVKCHTTAA